MPEVPTTPVWLEDPLPRLRRLSRGRPVVVIDDDPTGTQTVAEVPVVLRPERALIRAALEATPQVLFVLTNSRSRPEGEAIALADELGRTIRAIGLEVGLSLTVISRSDSTLRGHFPAEVDALAAGLGIPDARVLLAPFFGDGGRVTVRDTHYLIDGGRLQPVARSAYARDPAFGYRSSNLRTWVRDRLGDTRRWVGSVSLETIRESGPDAVAEAIQGTPPGGILIANAAEERDIEVVALGACLAEQAGVPIVARTAASYVRARAGLPRRSLLNINALGLGGPGVIVVGSHSTLSTIQLDTLLVSSARNHLQPVELSVVAVQGGSMLDVVRSATAAMNSGLSAGKTPVLFTSRRPLVDLGRGAGPDLPNRVSQAVCDVVRAIDRPFRWVLAKGGVTASDVATAALRVSSADVLGQLLPGVSLWRCLPEPAAPPFIYCVFPGNVGGPTALLEAYEALSRGAAA